VSSSTKASILIGLRENLGKLIKHGKPDVRETEMTKLIISGSGEEKDVKIEDDKIIKGPKSK
jgi:hypothetical protein